MKSIIVSMLLLLGSTAQVYATDFYASPTGTGTTCLTGSPCSIRSFFTSGKAVPGNRLLLKDGTYTGLDYSLRLQEWGVTANGASGNPIVIMAENDGQVLLDGQFVRSMILLRDNVSWLDIEGINVCCGGGTDTGAVLTIWGPAHHINVRRIVAWDANPNTATLLQPDRIISINTGANNILIEDCAAFGISQTMARTAFSTANTTWRRCWFRWEGAHGGSGPSSSTNLYRSSVTNNVLENVIVTWTGHRQGATAPVAGREGLAIATNGVSTHSVKLLGSIIYTKPGASFLPNRNLLSGYGASTILFQDVVSFVSSTQSHLPIHTVNCEGTPCSHVANRITSMRGSGTSIWGSDWSRTNVNEYTSVAAANSAGKNIFNGTNAATVCFQYQNGGLTTVPLWPWPMDARIKAAITTAGSQALAGVDQTVTSEIESIFGTIPSSCRDDFPIPPTDPPIVEAPSSVRAPVTDRPSVGADQITDRPTVTRPVP